MISDRQRKAIGPLPRQHGMLAVMLRDGQPLRLADIRADPRFEGWPRAHPELADILGMPIKDGDRVLGFIFAANKASGGGFTGRDEELLSLFAAHAAIALTNARLYERARQLSVLGGARPAGQGPARRGVAEAVQHPGQGPRGVGACGPGSGRPGTRSGRRPRWRAWPRWPAPPRPSCAR